MSSPKYYASGIPPDVVFRHGSQLLPAAHGHAEGMGAQDHRTLVRPPLIAALVADALPQLDWLSDALKHRLVGKHLLFGELVRHDGIM